MGHRVMVVHTHLGFTFGGTCFDGLGGGSTLMAE